MSGSTRSRLVVTDANVLINLAHVKRLGLVFENIVDGNAKPPDTWFAAALSRLNGDDLSIVHGCSQSSRRRGSRTMDGIHSS